jgi:hypothetical protein
MIMQLTRPRLPLSPFLASVFISACDSRRQPPSAALQDTSAPVEHPGYFGNLDVANCEQIAGCAWDSNQPDKSVGVNIYDGDKSLTTVVADKYREDLLWNRIGDGKHSFSYPVPTSLKDGKAHAIQAAIAETKVALQDSARSIICQAK